MGSRDRGGLGGVGPNRLVGTGLNWTDWSGLRRLEWVWLNVERRGRDERGGLVAGRVVGSGVGRTGVVTAGVESSEVGREDLNGHVGADVGRDDLSRNEQSEKMGVGMRSRGRIGRV